MTWGAAWEFIWQTAGTSVFMAFVFIFLDWLHPPKNKGGDDA